MKTTKVWRSLNTYGIVALTVVFGSTYLYAISLMVSQSSML